MTNNLGISKVDDIVEIELNQKADVIITELKKSYDDDINKITSQLDIYNGLLLNLKNVDELNKTYKLENSQLLKQLKDSTHDILTNERKTYYEDQENDVLNTHYYYFLWFIYIIIVLCIIVFSLIYPSQSSLKVKIMSIFGFILLPFISSWILGKVIYCIYWLFDLLPKNVYK